MALSMPAPNGRISVMSNSNTPNSDGLQSIMLSYDPQTYTVTVAPDCVAKDSMICFKTNSGKVKVVFLSPFGDEITTLLDSEARTISTGGCYHFNCYFTNADGVEFKSKTGGVIDVQPHRP
jgi:hypothetical protein